MVVAALLVFIKEMGLICDETLSIRSCSWFTLLAALTDEGRLFFLSYAEHPIGGGRGEGALAIH